MPDIPERAALECLVNGLIHRDYRAAVNYLPELEPRFYSDSSSFWVTLYNLNFYEKLGYSQPFGRAEIMNIISVSSYSAGELIKKMREAGLIEPVDGRGKGKYQFVIKPE